MSLKSLILASISLVLVIPLTLSCSFIVLYYECKLGGFADFVYKFLCLDMILSVQETTSGYNQP